MPPLRLHQRTTPQKKNLHRQGKIWDAILDGIEKVDPGHGDDAGGPLWGTTGSAFLVRIIVPILWVLAFRWLLNLIF